MSFGKSRIYNNVFVAIFALQDLLPSTFFYKIPINFLCYVADNIHNKSTVFFFVVL